jgi:hypothetical protein
MHIVLITNCSAAKALRATKALRASSVPIGPVSKVAKEWASRTRLSPRRLAASKMYKGQGAAIARRAAEKAGASWYIASAGLGLIHSSKLIPAYDVTVTADSGHACILRRIGASGKAKSSDWWMALNNALGKAQPLKRLIRRRKDALFVVAVSGPYLAMLTPELESLSVKQQARVRLIAACDSLVPDGLKHLRMPYDRRLNSKGSQFRGAYVSFAQRAASHFLSTVARTECRANAAEHHRRVKLNLAGCLPMRRKRRRRVSDSKLIGLARKLRRSGAATSTVALRHLRGMGYASEQSRFARAWGRVA